ncbi:STAS/SEC14 domain-containing protein [Leptolyngbyaceae cyanobacterium CCMR0082]|uniref:STAS/SEC14 domain-containing protein n=2 Tax=Adonisia turfae TaxID=2950184 RepID=A0A6M0SET7_9CYAN|nr:STAS/SEC14 domain-containing protein [Adonisia turfae]NEZ56071.1 STAS/SEC14 domain-containing protein [Adonisia turfae CCMR0081]NEZ67027.1 STAS/SEC14 domain-containing protein [Adonisia turfae CCMR0082]
MTSVQVTSQINIDLDQLLVGVAQLETPDLERFTEQVTQLLAQRRVSSLPVQETELLQQINQGLPPEIQQRYDQLQAKLQAETISIDEHQNLLTLIDTVEQADAKRLEALMTLAQLRQVSLPDLMAQLDIEPPPVHA